MTLTNKLKNRGKHALILILIVLVSSSLQMMSLNTLVSFSKAEGTKKKMALIGKKVHTTYGPNREKTHTKMTNREFKKFLADKTQKKIEKLTAKFKLQEDIKSGKAKAPSDKPKVPKLLYS